MIAIENNLKDLEAERFNLVARLCRKAIRYDKPICGCELKKVSSLPIGVAVFGDEFFSNQKVLDCIYSQFGLHAPNLGVTAVNNGEGLSPEGSESIVLSEFTFDCITNECTLLASYSGVPFNNNFVLYHNTGDGNWTQVLDYGIVYNSPNSVTFEITETVYPPTTTLSYKVVDSVSGYESPTYSPNASACEDEFIVVDAQTACTDGQADFDIYLKNINVVNSITIEGYILGSWIEVAVLGVSQVSLVSNTFEKITAHIDPSFVFQGMTINFRIKNTVSNYTSLVYTSVFNDCSTPGFVTISGSTVCPAGNALIEFDATSIPVGGSFRFEFFNETTKVWSFLADQMISSGDSTGNFTITTPGFIGSTVKVRCRKQSGGYVSDYFPIQFLNC